MAIPRPLLLALVGALLIAAALLASHSLAAAEEAPPPPPPAAVPATPANSAALPKLPAEVTRALERRELFVLLLTQRGADDAATRAAVREVEGDGVPVVRDSIAAAGRYGPLVAQLGLTRAPAVIVVGADRRARLLEGFVDAGSLRRHVADLRR